MKTLFITFFLCLILCFDSNTGSSQHQIRRDSIPAQRKLTDSQKVLLNQVVTMIRNNPSDMKEIKSALNRIAVGQDKIARNNDTTLSRAREVRDAFDAFRLQALKSNAQLIDYARRTEQARILEAYKAEVAERENKAFYDMFDIMAVGGALLAIVLLGFSNYQVYLIRNQRLITS